MAVRQAGGPDRPGPITIETVAEPDVQKLVEHDVHSLLEEARQDAQRMNRYAEAYTEPPRTAWEDIDGPRVAAFFTTLLHALRSPGRFFRALSADRVGPALVFAALIMIPVSVVQGATAHLWSRYLGLDGLVLVPPSLLVAYLAGMLPLVLLYFVATYHAGATLLSRRRLRITGVVRATCYGSSPMILALVPGVGLAVGIVGMFILHFFALHAHLGLDKKRAFVAVLMPIVPVVSTIAFGKPF